MKERSTQYNLFDFSRLSLNRFSLPNLAKHSSRAESFTWKELSVPYLTWRANSLVRIVNECQLVGARALRRWAQRWSSQRINRKFQSNNRKSFEMNNLILNSRVWQYPLPSTHMLRKRDVLELGPGKSVSPAVSKTLKSRRGSILFSPALKCAASLKTWPKWVIMGGATGWKCHELITKANKFQIRVSVSQPNSRHQGRLTSWLAGWMCFLLIGFVF